MQAPAETTHRRTHHGAKRFAPWLLLRAERIHAMFDRVVNSEIMQRVARQVAPGRAVRLGGVWGSAGPLIAAAQGAIGHAPVLYVTPHLDDADAVADDIQLFTGTAPAIFPAWEAQLATDHVSEEVTGQRLALLNRLAEGRTPAVVIAPVMALLQPVPTPDALAAGRRLIERGQTLGMDELVDWLVEAGYGPADPIDEQGEFARRGGIVDVFPVGETRAVRIEFFGDEVDSIRLVDLDTQRSVEQVEAASITALTVGRSIPPAEAGPEGTARRSGSRAAARSAPTPQTTHVLDYVPTGTIVCMTEPDEIRDLAGQLYDRVRDDLVEEASPVALRHPDEVFAALAAFGRIDCTLFAPSRTSANGDSPDLPSKRGLSPFSERMGIRSLERLQINTAEAIGELEDLAEVSDVWIYCDNDAERDRFETLIAEQHPGLSGATLAIGHVSTGFHWPALRLTVVGHHELYHRYAKVRRIRRVRTGRPIESLVDLAEGDYVVHVAHGIAKFDGLKRLERNGVTEEYLRLRFALNAVVHVPVSQINLVQKYIGAGGRRPNLSKLGGKAWTRTKERVSEAVRDLAAEMLRVQAARRAMPGTSYPRETDLQRQFAEEFLYVETPDQLAAIQQIDADLAEQRPMDRLLCGDVGFGKTEVAMRAALKVVEGGKQVAVLVPTTVLADQHHRTFRERMADFPVTVDAISRFRTAKEQADIIRRLKLGQIDILIGTHRLLSADVQFPELGLIVIDEEQRFGVGHKEQLKAMRATVDVLTLTATPIPRTLHMALLGLRDICSLQTPPMDRRAIHTEVVPRDDSLIRAALLRELNRGGQVYFVHNRVQDIDAVARSVEKLVPGARIAVGHGQMGERGLEKVMLAFTRGEVDVLVCTTIIESGLDIPTANTMIIHECDRFGLADLHQLRGRVGRYKHRAYCYLLLPERRTVNPAAAKRLKAIEDFSDLGAGFQIAMRDLEIRGAGNILGREQSGHIATVGYELYCQLLEQAVTSLRKRGQEPFSATHGLSQSDDTLDGDKRFLTPFSDGPPDVHVEIGIDAYIPKTYIPSERQRLEIYRRMVLCRDIDDLTRLRADLADAFGPPPPGLDTLLDVAELRIHATRLGISSIILMNRDLIFTIRDARQADLPFRDAPGSVRLPDENTIYWRPPPNYLEMPTMLTVLLNRLRGKEHQE